MKSQVSVGHLTANGDFISPGPWGIFLFDGGEAQDRQLPNWDYFVDVLITRTFEIDLSALCDQVRLSADAHLSAVLLWHSTGTNLRGASKPVRLVDGVGELAARLPGGELGGRLNLELRIILARRGTRDGALAPRRPGNVIWSDDYQVELEGSGSRFPVIPIDFGEVGFGAGRRGAWYLGVSAEDLSASALGNIRVYLNTAHPQIEAALKNSDAETSKAYLYMIRYDIARQLLQYALRREDFSLEDGYERESIGHILQRYVGLFGQSLSELRIRLDEDPGDLEAEFQALTGLVDLWYTSIRGSANQSHVK